ncbi:hypothetical protein IFM89_025469 [Coptis chinensis]|uniref:Protein DETOXIFICATION n=1 Tax=Coptis chinensis TaxID=261450 RepID=A0A835LSV6_9MAGN|nr:hypothetical protein IFM89_025469 [Coptis chinensis]
MMDPVGTNNATLPQQNHERDEGGRISLKEERRSSSRSSTSTSSPEMKASLINGDTSIDTGELLHHAPTTALPNVDDPSKDYPNVTNFSEAKSICWMETVKLWAIAGPIAFNIICVYGINSITQIFVGHIGDVELSAIAIAMSVISTFSFGFLGECLFFVIIHFLPQNKFLSKCHQKIGFYWLLDMFDEIYFNYHLDDSGFLHTILIRIPITRLDAQVNHLEQQLGMGSALETLCGQAFGAGQVFMLGVYMQRSWIILLVTCVILCPIYIYATPVLKLLGQEDDIADLAGKFAIQIIPQMFSLAINFPTQKFLQSQSKVAALAYIGAVALLFHVFLLWLFIHVFDWGTGGAAAAYDISGWIVALAQVVYVIRYCKDGWKGLSMLAFKEIWAFVRLSLASAVMLCLEVWYMMVLVVLTGHLKNAVIAVGSISICMNINGWEAMLFIGINAAISVRVSNELGSGHPRAAKYSVIVVILEALLIGLFFMFLILITKDDFAVIFTSSKELQKAVAQLAPLLGVTMVLNSVQPVISGVAVGGGWQALVAYINLACYYVFGLPLGFLLGYVFKLGVQGIWVGMLWGTGLQTAVLLVIIGKTNWNKEAAQASGVMSVGWCRLRYEFLVINLAAAKKRKTFVGFWSIK